jgi:tRNA1Val (adenine37-N6)-methyltransferase
MPFRFLQFTVEDEQSSLRVGTDAMLLGSWADPGMAKKILDIGTGCGVLALMMAQKSDAVIEAIDIDQPSVVEAGNNFSKSPWSSRISAIPSSLQDFSCPAPVGYDFIITNPPYYANSLQSPSARINRTRHNNSLSQVELVRIVSRLLTNEGCFALILPAEQENTFQTICGESGLHLSRRLVIFPKPAMLPKRILMEFTKNKAASPESSALTILDATGAYTPEYLSLTRLFHNF